MRRIYKWITCLLAAILASGLFVPDPLASAGAREPITLLAAGDNLIHDVIYWQAKQADGSYDFSSVYERIKPFVQAADIAFINQETPMVPDREPASYPMFNTPVEMAANLREAGFDVLAVANNHMLDMGASGLQQTLAVIRETPGLTVTGGYRDKADQDNIPLVEVKGVRMAFLAFPEQTNGLVLPEAHRDAILYLDQEAEVERLVRKARQEADIVVAGAHWGAEFSTRASEGQREMAGKLADWGADLVIGTHPHVLQEAEWLERAGGGRTLVLYSLGNLVSAQVTAETLVAALAEVTFAWNGRAGRYEALGCSYRPIVTHYGPGFGGLSVYPVEAYTAELAAGHGVRAKGVAFSLEKINQVIKNTLGREPGTAAGGRLPHTKQKG